MTAPASNHRGGRHGTAPASNDDEGGRVAAAVSNDVEDRRGTAPASSAAPTVPAEWRRRQEEQALAYHFLGRCFYEPPRAEWLAALAGDRLFEAWPFPSRDDATAAGLALLNAFCAGWDPARLGALEWDFNRLFVGPGEMLAPPWESVHRSKTKLTFQEPTLQVRELYRRFGVAAPAIHREPDDHLGLELAFVATLSDHAAGAAARGDAAHLARCFQAQRDFLRDHLLAWAPACLALVEKHAETDYYRGGARLALGSLAESAHLCGVGPSR